MASNATQSQRPLPPPPPDWHPAERPPPPRKRGRAGKAIAILLILLVLFAIIFYTPLANMFLSELMGNRYPASSSFMLTRQISVDVSRGDINYVLDLPLPGLVMTDFKGRTQEVTRVATSPQADTVSKNGGSWLQWEGTANGPFSVEVTYWATVNTVRWDISSSYSGATSDIPQELVSVQTGDEWEIVDSDGNPMGEYMIWPSHPTIRNLANRLAPDDSNVYDNVRSIYNHIRNSIDYSTIPGQSAKSCLQTLSDGTGDCDDQSILLISLCRSAGIPSWLAFGVLHDSARGQWGAHAWAEVYMPYLGGTGEAMTIDPANGEFLVRNCNRLEEWKSDGIGEHLADYYSLLSYNYTASGPVPLAPVVTLTESYSGEYRESKEYACIRMSMESGLHLVGEMAAASPQKV